MKSSPEIMRGAHVAKKLGWPAADRGFWGALGSLPSGMFARYETPRSYISCLSEYRTGSDLAVREHLIGSIHSYIR